MLVHSVYFWLKSELTEAEVAEFHQGLESLCGIKSAESVYVGAPADTPPRPVIDTSYSFALVVVLKDREAHDTYQVDPLHTAFLERFKPYWEKVLIYDVG